jgi:division protein CdvB (Snf7/Vps24/ESCRT-III family)
MSASDDNDPIEELTQMFEDGPFADLLEDTDVNPEDFVQDLIDAADETNTALEDLFIEFNESSPFPGSDILAEIGEETQQTRKELLDMLRDAAEDAGDRGRN